MNNKKLEEMAETIVTEKISYGGLEYSLAGKIHKDCVKSCILGMKYALSLPEVKAMIEAGDNMREELTNYWGGSKGELEWLKALADMGKVMGEN